MTIDKQDIRDLSNLENVTSEVCFGKPYFYNLYGVAQWTGKVKHCVNT